MVGVGVIYCVFRIDHPSSDYFFIMEIGWKKIESSLHVHFLNPFAMQQLRVYMNYRVNTEINYFHPEKLFIN